MSVAITTTLSEQVLEELKTYAAKSGKKKNQIIEESLEMFFEKLKQKKLESSFKKAALEMDIIEMAEDGLDDSLNQLNTLEN